ARIDHPVGPPRAWAIFAHGYNSSKHTLVVSRVSAALANLGIGVLRFDFTGRGESFADSLEDLLVAVRFMEKAGTAPQILIGHSLGGAVALAAAGEVESVKAVVTLNSPSGAKREGGAEFLANVGHLKKAVLIVHSPTDDIVGIDNASALFAAAKHPKSFISLDGADHAISAKADALYLAQLIAAWSVRYVEAPAALPEDVTESDAVVVEESGPGRYANTVIIGPHRLMADEPLSMPEGTGTGPAPYDFLLAGLGACTSMTVRMYAELKSIPLERISVRLTHRKIHAQDCVDCESREGKVDRMEREIELTGDLTPEQRARLLEIANKCPVHRTLLGEIKVDTRLVE
ncbi:MAG: osmotically inducible protein C, partial [Alphaproteobacteria bacterium RIFOXYD12_FULL_60_8]